MLSHAETSVESDVKPLPSVYCSSCHLATPIWRGRCIHCRQLLPSHNSKSHIQRVATPRQHKMSPL